MPSTPPEPLPQNIVADLRAALPADALLTDPADCLPYGYDNSRRVACPQAVALPTTTEQVAAVVKACHTHQVPVVTRGRATNTVGGTVPIHGGLVLSLERMAQIIAIRPDDRLAEVEAGVINGELQTALGEHGFFWPPDPTSAGYSSVGGNLACNAAGPRAVKYGTCRDNVLGLQFVDGRGRIINTGVYTTKGVVGYDLTRLMVGSEGTLGIITKAVLAITPVAEEKRTLRGLYDSVTTAGDAVARIMAQPEIPCALEFIDTASIEVIRNNVRDAEVDLPPDAAAMLMIEVDGSADAIGPAMAAVEAAARGPGLVELKTATTADEIAALWQTRKALSPALRKLAPKKINEDVVVPVSRMPELIDGLGKLSAEHKVRIVNFGHAGNGNLHVNLLGEEADLPRMHTCLDAVFDLVLQLEGTLSGEHGVGIEKRPFIAREISGDALDLMRSLKGVFDPAGIMNPGKLLPD
ncbi:FAD-binding protein [bacterium]|nr:FAD-binding protein [bacterium]